MGVKTNYARDVRAEFGEYVQAKVVTTELTSRGTSERTVGAIALVSADNNKGTWWFMSLRTGAPFRADSWTPLPITDVVIDLMNNMYNTDETEDKTASKKIRGCKKAIVTLPEDANEVNSMLRLPGERDAQVQDLPPSTMAAPLSDESLDHSEADIAVMDTGINNSEDIQDNNDETGGDHVDNNINNDDDNTYGGEDIGLADTYEHLRENLGARIVAGQRR